jgi:hypothetical protein
MRRRIPDRSRGQWAGDPLYQYRDDPGLQVIIIDSLHDPHQKTDSGPASNIEPFERNPAVHVAWWPSSKSWVPAVRADMS